MRSTGAGLTAVGIAVMNGLTGCKAAGSAIAICDPVISFTTQGPVMTKPDTVELPVVAQALLVKPRKSEYWHSCRECEGQWLSSHKRDIACPFCALIHAAPRLQAAEEAIERVQRLIPQWRTEASEERISAGNDGCCESLAVYLENCADELGEALTPPNEDKGDG